MKCILEGLKGLHIRMEFKLNHFGYGVNPLCPLVPTSSSSPWICPVMGVIEGKWQIKRNLGESAEKLLTSCNGVHTIFVCIEESKFIVFRQVFKRVIYKVTDLFYPINHCSVLSWNHRCPLCIPLAQSATHIFLIYFCLNESWFLIFVPFSVS